MRDPRMWRLSIGSGLVLAAQISILSFLILFLHQERGLSTAAAAGVFAVIQALGAVLRIVSGRWSDRVQARIAPLRRLALALDCHARRRRGVLLSAPLAILIPVFVAAGALSLSWNGLSFTAAAELAGQSASRRRTRLSADGACDHERSGTARVRGRRRGGLVVARLRARGGDADRRHRRHAPAFPLSSSRARLRLLRRARRCRLP